MRLSTRTLRAMGRRRKRFGKPYRYNPRWNLVRRIAEEESISLAEARFKILGLTNDRNDF